MNSGRIHKKLMEMAICKKRRRAGWIGTGLKARFSSIFSYKTSLGIVIEIKLQRTMWKMRKRWYILTFFPADVSNTIQSQIKIKIVLSKYDSSDRARPKLLTSRPDIRWQSPLCRQGLFRPFTTAGLWRPKKPGF